MGRLLSFAFIYALFWIAPTWADLAWESGKPGCYPEVYAQGLRAYTKNASEFVEQVSKILSHNQTHEPAYRAILVAVVFADERFRPALEARAKVERQKKLRYPYAVAALERLKTGQCSSKFASVNFSEICFSKSLLADRIVALTERGKK